MGAGTGPPGAMPPVAAVAAVGAASATSESSVAISFDDPLIGASSAGGGFHGRYRHRPVGAEVLQGPAQPLTGSAGHAYFVVVRNEDVTARASELTAVSVIAVVTRTL